MVTKPSQTAPESSFQPMQHACPKCGYCPHCGRSNAQPWPAYPWPYFQPWWGVTPPYPSPYYRLGNTWSDVTGGNYTVSI